MDIIFGVMNYCILINSFRVSGVNGDVKPVQAVSIDILLNNEDKRVNARRGYGLYFIKRRPDA